MLLVFDLLLILTGFILESLLLSLKTLLQKTCNLQVVLGLFRAVVQLLQSYAVIKCQYLKSKYHVCVTNSVFYLVSIRALLIYWNVEHENENTPSSLFNSSEDGIAIMCSQMIFSFISIIFPWKSDMKAICAMSLSFLHFSPYYEATFTSR